MKQILYTAVFMTLLLSPFCGFGAEPTPLPKRPNIVEASKAAKEARKNSSESKNGTWIISNKTLETDPDQGQLTMSTSVNAASDITAEEKKLEYWRRKYQDQLQLMSDLEHEITKLDTSISTLWHQFYGMDDVENRDRVIVPKLNAALKKRHNDTERLRVENDTCSDILRQARLAGSLPSWFRDMKKPNVAKP